ncbi:MAG: hypothetical protein U5K72_07960 [Balneolaceae bacterium]|nr:hypothetical protein [Balneolaceae bacterium]
MGIRLDLVFSFIIVGMLTLMIFGVNSFILQNSVDNRLYNDMQMFADVSTDVFQEELKRAVDVIQPANASMPSNILRFVDLNGDTVTVQRDGRVVELVRSSASLDTVRYDLYLSGLEFDLEPDTVAVPHYLRVTFRTESDPSQHVSFQNNTETANAFSQRRYYLRNVHLIAEGGGPGGGGTGSGGGNNDDGSTGGENDGGGGGDDGGGNNNDDGGGGPPGGGPPPCSGPPSQRPPGC